MTLPAAAPHQGALTPCKGTADREGQLPAVPCAPAAPSLLSSHCLCAVDVTTCPPRVLGRGQEEGEKWFQRTKSSQGEARDGDRVWVLTFEQLYGPQTGVVRQEGEE